MKALVSKRSLEIRDLNGALHKNEEVSALAELLGTLDIESLFRLHVFFSGVEDCSGSSSKGGRFKSTPAEESEGPVGELPLPGEHAEVSFRRRKRFHRVSSSCSRCLTCVNRGGKYVAHVNGISFYRVFKEEIKEV